MNRAQHVVVIGAGLAGLTAALRAREAGLTVTLVHFGTGGLQLSQGSIDILGYAPERVADPVAALPALAAARPDHPYARLGADAGDLIEESAGWLTETLGRELLVGDVRRNLNLPTAVGAIRPTALAVPSVAAGDLTPRPGAAGPRVVVVGLRQLKDFQAQLIAANLTAQGFDWAGLSARAVLLDHPAREGVSDSSALAYARALDDEDYARRFISALQKVVEPSETVALPAILGLRELGLPARIADALGTQVCEIPLPPPGVPGMRLNMALMDKAKAARIRLIGGSRVAGLVADSSARITSVTVDTDARPFEIACDHVIHAPGGFESGALHVDSYGVVSERAFGLPLTGAGGDDLIHGDYWGEEQPLFMAGVAVDEGMRVLDEGGRPVHPNLYAAGGILAGASRWREKSGDGIALASAYRAVATIVEEQR